MKIKVIFLYIGLFVFLSNAFAQKVEIGGIAYNLSSDLTASVTSKNPHYSGDITIPSTVTNNGINYRVTSIGYQAFSVCRGLTSITIPNSVTSIGDYAFWGCAGLTSITIPNSVTSIGYSAFYGCDGLTSITIPNSVTSIGNSAFSNCSGLTSITIPNSVTSIGYGASHGCDGLTSIIVELGNSVYDSRNNCNAIIETSTNKLIAGCKNTVIPNSVTSIGDYAFEGCSGLTSITIPNCVTSIGDDAFSSCSGLTSITIPNSVTSIGNSAFWGCSGLTSITIPNSVTSIGGWAFSDCSGLTSVIIGNSVTSIGRNAFSGCVRLTSITCEAKTPPSCNISSDYNSFKNIPANCTIKVPCGCLEAYNRAPWYNYQLTIIPPPSLQVQPSSESLGSTTIDQEVDCDSTAIVSATAIYGYHFVQWTDSATSNPRTIKLTKDTLLTAEFARNNYQITTSYTGNGMTLGDTTALYQDTITLNALADYGWDFSGWEDGNTDNPRVVVATEDKDYKAIFVRQQFSLTAIAENGVVNGVGTFAYETNCSLTATPATGYHFVQWSDGVTENPRSIVLTKDTNLTAEFAKNSYKITTQSTVSQVCAISAPMQAEYLDTVEIVVSILDASYRFRYWNDGNTENPRRVVLTQDTAFTATVNNQYVLSGVSEHGTITGAGEYPYGSYVMLAVIPDNGYKFLRWSDGTIYNPYSLVLEKDVTVEAIMEPVASEVDEHESDDHSATKIMKDGAIYIIKNGQMYNLYGMLIEGTE